MIVVFCPNGHKLAVADEHAGKTAICGVCQATMRIPDLPPPPAAPLLVTEIQPARPPQEPAYEAVGELVEERDDPQGRVGPFQAADADAERRYRKKKKSGETRRKKALRAQVQALRIVNLGLGFRYAALIVFILALVVNISLGISVAASFFSGDSSSVFFLSNLLIVLRGFIYPALEITGAILCLRVPQTQARVFLAVSLGLSAIIFIMGVALLAGGPGGGGYTAMVLISSVFGLSSWAMFMLFLKALSEFLDENALANEAIRLIVKGIFILVATLVLMVMASSIKRVPFLLLWLFSLPALIFWLIFVFQFLFEILALVGSIRQVISARW